MNDYARDLGDQRVAGTHTKVGPRFWSPNFWSLSDLIVDDWSTVRNGSYCLSNPISTRRYAMQLCLSLENSVVASTRTKLLD